MFPLGVLSLQNLTVVLDAQFTTDATDATGNHTLLIGGTVPISGGVASFSNNASNYLTYNGTKLRLQTDTEFTIRFKILTKGENHMLLSCLNNAGSNGFYIFVNELVGVLGFYSVGLGAFSFTSAAIPIGVFTTVRCIVQKARQRMLIYVDGVLLSTIVSADIANLTNEPRFVNLGSISPANTAQPLKGEIDFVTVRER